MLHVACHHSAMENKAKYNDPTRLYRAIKGTVVSIAIVMLSVPSNVIQRAGDAKRELYIHPYGC